MKCLKFWYMSLCFLIYSLSLQADDCCVTREKDKEAIISHVVGIVNNVANLVKDPDDENVIGSNIVGLFTNILGCIFAASKRSDISFDMDCEEITILLASLDQELIEDIQKAVIKRVKQIRDV